MDLAEKRVVVTGGAGFIGSHVVDQLAALGSEVVVIDDLSTGERSNLADAEATGAVSLVEGDVRDAELIDRELSGAGAVIHMACGNLRASLGAPMESHGINATGSLTIALAAARHHVERFVYVSSSEAYGTAVRTPMAEDHPLNPTTVYGAAKAAGELYALACLRTYGLPATVVRPFNSYGPREHAVGTSAEVIPKFVTRLLAALPPVIFGDGSQTRDFTWVEETAAGILAATQSEELVGEAVNIAYGKGVSIREVCDLLCEILDASDLGPQFQDERPGDVQHHFAGTAKARETLGFEATVSLREGLERYVEHMRASDQAEAIGREEAVRNW